MVALTPLLALQVRQNRRLRRSLASVAVVAVVALLAGAIALQQWVRIPPRAPSARFSVFRAPTGFVAAEGEFWYLADRLRPARGA
jgi:hypothetical protein